MASKVLGAQSLRRKLKRLPDHIKKPVQQAIVEGADILHRDMAAGAPVETGALRDSIRTRISSDKLGARVGFFEKGGKREWKKAGWRAHFVEFGTRQRPATPFIQPAAFRTFPLILKNIKAAVNRALEKASEL